MDSFKKTNPDGKYALRLGREVPEGDVNLAYIHVPPLKVEENVQLVDVSNSLIQNLVMLDRLESLVGPDYGGMLHFIGVSPLGGYYYSGAEMPTPYFALTGRFHDDQVDTVRALYYKYSFKHYDEPGLEGPYAGSAIALLDGDVAVEGVNIELASTANPRVYDAVLYAHVTTDAERTYKIRYNKVDGESVLNGYEEIFNGEPVYEEGTLENVLSAPSSAEVYALEETPRSDYRVYVPQKAQLDPRKWHEFSWRLSANFVRDEPDTHIKAGILVWKGMQFTNPDPYIFYVIENHPANTSLPNPYVFTNPYAPAGYTKNQKRYWEVNLNSMTVSQLMGYDVLVLCNRDKTYFTDLERDKLERWVAMGGKLWVDTGMWTELVNFFLPINFVGKDGYTFHLTQKFVDPEHPIYTMAPYPVTTEEQLSRVGYYEPETNQWGLYQPYRNAQIVNWEEAGFIEMARWSDDSSPSQCWRPYGKGVILFTGTNTTSGINDFAGSVDTTVVGDRNSQDVSGTNFEAVNPISVQFAINFCRWFKSYESYTFGWVSDRLTAVPLAQEAPDYTSGGKKLTVLNLSAKDLIRQVLPVGFPDSPYYSQYILEKQGDPVVTVVLPGPDAIGVASTSEPDTAWSVAPTDILVDTPINFVFTVFPELALADRQWDFTVTGEGKRNFSVPLNTDVSYQVSAAIEYRGTTQVLSESILNTWHNFSSTGDTSQAHWEVESGYLTETKNNLCISGYYNPADTDLTDYEVTFTVRVDDEIDDDAIGFLFRVQDDKHYYYFLWERDDRSFVDGYEGRYDPVPGGDGTDYVTNQPGREDIDGLGSYHKRFFKSKSSGLNYKLDSGGQQAIDSTSWGSSNEGWRPHVDYYVRILVVGDHFQLAVSSSGDPGTQWKLDAYDDDYSYGAFGPLAWSQMQAKFRDIAYSVVNNNTVYSGTLTATLDGTNNSYGSAKQLNAQTAAQLLSGAIASWKTANGVTDDDIIQITYGISASTAGVEVFLDDAGYPMGYVSDTSLLNVPVGDRLWNFKGYRYVSKDSAVTGNVVETTFADQAAALSIPNLSAGNLASTAGGLMLGDNYKGADIPSSDFSGLFCALHNRTETLPTSTGMPYKSLQAVTYVWVESPVTITPKVLASDFLSVEVNGSLVYTGGYSNGFSIPVSLNLNAGWNKLYFYLEDTDQPKTAEVAHLGDGTAVRANNSFLALEHPLSFYLDATGKKYAINSYQPGTVTYSVTVEGTGLATYDNGWTYTLIPADLSSISIPGDVYDFAWTGVVTSDPLVRMWVDGNTVQALIEEEIYEYVGTPHTYEAAITKEDDLKTLVTAEQVIDDLNIPVDVPQNKIRLRVETGDVNGNFKEPRVNLRMRSNGRFLLNALGENEAAYLDFVGGEILGFTAYQQLTAFHPMAIRFDSSRHVSVDLPRPHDVLLDNWYLRIRNGRFSREVLLPSSGAIYRSYPELDPYRNRKVTMVYTIPEYKKEPYVPIKQVVGAPLELADERVLKAPDSPLLNVTSVVLNPGQANARSLTVLDVDRAKGLIYVREKVRAQDRAYADYSCREDYYTYRGFYRDTVFYHLDLNPSPGHSFSSQASGIPGDLPLASAGSKEELPGQNLLSRTIYVYLRPTAIYLDERIISGALREKAVFHTDDSRPFDPASNAYDPSLFLLARVYVRPNSSQEDVVVLDTRSRGGGLVEAGGTHLYDEGFFDGLPYPAQGVILVRLPKSILKENGGLFTPAQVEQVVQKHLAFGVLPLIEYF